MLAIALSLGDWAFLAHILGTELVRTVIQVALALNDVLNSVNSDFELFCRSAEKEIVFLY